MNRAGLGLAVALILAPALTTSTPIDRYALVSRHNPTLRGPDPLSPLSLGNGGFAFTADITGLQTFPRFYDRDAQPAGSRGSTPLVTESEWGWHSFPNPHGYTLADTFEKYDAHGRPVEYASRQDSAAGAWLRENPHKINLARVGFSIRKSDGSEAALDDLQQTEQTLDLWTGMLSSRFSLDGAPVQVESWVHPERDLLAVRVRPGALPPSRIGVRLAFPSAQSIHSGDPSGWAATDRGRTVVARRTARDIEWRRTLDETAYSVSLGWAGAARVEGHGPDWVLSFDRTDGPLEFVVAFSEHPIDAPLPDVESTRPRARSTGGASGSRGVRWTSRAAPIRAPPSSSVAWCCRST